MTIQHSRTFHRCVLSLAILFGMAVSAVGQTLVPLSQNGEFLGLSGWTSVNSGASILSPSPTDARLQLTGNSGVWQYVPLASPAKYQLLNVQACKRTRTGSGTAGWAGIGVTYYDAGWGVIDSFEKQINGPAVVGSNLGIPCSLGVRVPPNAAHAIIWAANEADNTEAFFDDLFLLDYLEDESYRMTFGPNPNNTYSYQQFDIFGNPHFLSGLQFWNTIDFIDLGSGSLGRAGASCAIAQEIEVQPGSVYNTQCFANFRPQLNGTVANFGFDFFDANWNRVGGVFKSFIGFDVTIRFRTPANAAHTVMWAWVDAVDANDNLLGPMSIYIQESGTAGVPDTNPPVMEIVDPIPDFQSGGGFLPVGFNTLVTQIADDISGVDTDSLAGPEVAIAIRGPSGRIYEMRSTFNSLGGEEAYFEHFVDFSREEPGTYTVFLKPNILRDNAGNRSPGRDLATFAVRPPLTVAP